MMTDHSPIIVGSAPSSGSTLLVNIIGRVQGIYQTHELSIFDKVDWFDLAPDDLRRRWPAMVKRGYRRRLACEMRPLFTGVSGELPAPRPGDDYLSFIVRYMSEQAQSRGCRRWVEKTPANIFAMRRLARAVPAFRCVVITRDARACITSLLRRGYSPVLAVARWYLSNLKACALENESLAIKVKYEDLVADPSGTIRALLNRLGEPFSDSLLDPEQGEKPVSSWSASPTDSVRPVAIWGEERTLDRRSAAVFARMRVSESYAEDFAFSGRIPSPSELQELLGYPPVVNDIDARQYGAGLVAMAHDAARYWAGMIANSHMPKKIPFTLLR